LLCSISDIQGLFFGWEEREIEESLMSETLWRARGWLAAKAQAAAAVPSAWPRMRQVILYALAEFPEAQAAVAAAIREFTTPEDDEK
jgi:hypothetical protein